MVLLGHVKGVEGSCISLHKDLKENLAKADLFEEDFVSEVDNYIERYHLNIPPETLPTLDDGYAVDEIPELDLHQVGIQTIIWATGYQFDFSWIKLPVFDAEGYPIHRRGITRSPGLYFIGLPFLHTGISGVIAGVGPDAQFITADIKQKDRKKLMV